MPEEKVIIFDTTLRDGEQSAGAGMTVEDKLQIASQLDRLGVDVIEAGFAAASPGDFEAVQRISKQVRRPIIASLSRANPADVDRAAEALKGAERPRIHVFLSSSDIHLLHQMRKNQEEVLIMAVENVARAKRYTADVEFSPMDASRTGEDFLCRVVEAVINAGATTVNIPDSVGYAIPEQFGALIKALLNRVPNIHKAVVSVHCHNDLGLAVANSLAAVRAGARQVEGCINGLGERAGNAALEEIIMALHTRKDLFSVTTNIDTAQIYPTSRLVSEIFGFPVQYNKAIVGLNAFRHASGIHQDAVLKERVTFEIMDPATVGWRGTSLVLGKLSGRAGLRARLEELGFHPATDELNQIFEAFKALADKKREVTDLDLELLMAEQRRVVDTRMYRLEHVQVRTGSAETPTATVRLACPDGATVTGTSTGNGPVDAVCKAIAKLVGVEPALDEYVVHSVTGGLDSVAQVTIRLNYQGRLYVGRGADTDVIVASGKGYLNALNRLLAAETIANRTAAAS
ncbi:MAG: 2-isopropylmalate synthase [Dehalococcoidia bacterium]|nr:2-isopropylmalate synthase [Dehalococcoidia bacterium]